MQAMTATFSKLKLESYKRINNPCVSCSNNNSTQKAQCGHYYCNECIRTMCTMGLKDRTQVPARCCKQNFVQEWIADCLTTSQLVLYKSYQLNINSIAKKDLDPEYEREVLKQGWKLCSQCGAGIQKTMNCNHMTCIMCKHQFCYACGVTWDKLAGGCQCSLNAPFTSTRIQMVKVEKERIDLETGHQWGRVKRHGEYDALYCDCGMLCVYWHWDCSYCGIQRCSGCAMYR